MVRNILEVKLQIEIFRCCGSAGHVMSNNKVSVIPTMEKVNYVDFLCSHTAYKKATVVFLSTKSALLLGTLV